MNRAMIAITTLVEHMVHKHPVHSEDFDRELAESAIRYITKWAKDHNADNDILSMSLGIVIGRLHKLEQEAKNAKH